MLKVLVACEYSGRVRDAFIRNGFNAISCDLLESEAPGPHVQGDVSDLLKQRWDLIIAHPPCTYLANSGVRWRVERNEWLEVQQGSEFFLECLNANSNFVAVENPVMHKYARNVIGRRADFTVQPWQFGDNESKRTCFWTRNLPPLEPEIINRPDKIDQSCWKSPPSKDRWKDRSRTYQGIANAMADQWGRYIKEHYA